MDAHIRHNFLQGTQAKACGYILTSYFLLLTSYILLPAWTDLKVCPYVLPYLYGYAYAQEAETPPASSMLEQGRALLNKGDYDAALSILLEAAAEEPEEPGIYNYLGEAYFRLKRLKEALDALKKSIALRPDYISPHLGLGIVYETMGDMEGAAREYEEVLRIGKGIPDAPEVKLAGEMLKRIEVREHIRKGRGLFGQGKFDEALAEVKTGISKDAANPVLHFMAGSIYRELGNPKDAYDAFKKVIETQPGNAAAHFQIGNLHFRFGAYKEAIDEFREAIRLAPDADDVPEAESLIKKSEGRLNIRGYFDEAAEAVKNEKYGPAEETLQKILNLEPDNGFALYNIGVIFFKTGRLEEAVKALEKSLEINTMDLKARYQLAVVYDDLGRSEEAIKEYEKVVASESKIEEVTTAKERVEIIKRLVSAKKGVERIIVLMESGDLEKAVKEAEELIAIETKNEKAHLTMGQIQMRMGKIDKAVESIKKAINIKQDFWEAYIQLGQMYEQWKRYNEAAEAFRVVASSAPETKEGVLAAGLLKNVLVSLHFERARKYMDGGDLDGSIKEIGRILEIASDNPVALYNAGVLSHMLNRPEDAEVYFKKAIEITPDYVQAHLQLALLYQAVQRFDEAEEEFKAVLSITQEGKEASIAKMKLGMIKEEEALSAHLKKANQLIKKGDYVGAEEELEAIVAISPENYMAYFQLGVIRDRMERGEESIEALKRAVEIKQDYATGYLYLGRVYEKEEMAGDAREVYRKAVRFGEGTRDGEIAAIRLKGLRNWRLQAGMGHTLDSNISYGEERRVGISTGHNLGLSYNIFRTREKGLTVNPSVSQSLNYQSQLINLTFRGNTGWKQEIRKGQSYGVNASYTYGLFENKPIYRSYSYSMNTSLSPDIIHTSLSLSYSFSSMISFVSKASDANSHSLSFSLSQALSPLDKVSGSYSFSTSINKRPEGSRNAKRSNSVSLRYNRIIMPGFSAGVGYSIGLTNYSNPDITTLYTRFRRNISQTISTDISYQLSENVSLSLNVNTANVTTNLARPTAEERKELEDILAEPVPQVSGGYRKETYALSIGVVF